MYELIIHNDATNDLKGIMAADRKVGMKLALLLRQLKVDQDSLDRLSSDKFGGRPAKPIPSKAKFNVSVWGAAQIRGMNLWRLRFYDPDSLGYRIIYAFFPASNQYIVLGILKKAEEGNYSDDRFDYEINHPLSARIFRAYSKLTD